VLDGPEPTGYGSPVSDRRSPVDALYRALQVPLGHPSGSLGHAGVEILGVVPLFSGLSKRQLRSLADRTKVVRYGPGRSVLGEGVRGGSSMFVLLEGTARVVRGGRTIRRLGPGDVFGELALLDGRPRSASVVTVSPVVTARLSRTAFFDLVRSEPDIGLRLMEVLASRLRDCERGRDA
jgi:CRP/FNR family transcriptional regulator, cyclic AMP receptor protein